MSQVQNPLEFENTSFEEEKALELLADCIYERFQKTLLLEGQDPFEYYAHQLRGSWYKERSVFLERFLKGYRLIKKY